eukprot:2951135-Rhodomonas_salina.2
MKSAVDVKTAVVQIRASGELVSRCKVQKSGVPRCERRSLLPCMKSAMCVRRGCRVRCVAKGVYVCDW